VVELRKTLLPPLDDLLAVTHEFIHPAVSRSGLGPLSAPPRDFYPQGADGKHQDAGEDLQGICAGLCARRCRTRSNAATCSLPLIGRRAGFYVEILEDKPATAASDFRARLIDKAPFTISKVLTDSGKEFTEIASVPPASASRPVPCLRSGLYRQPHRAPAYQTESSPNQRHDRTLQRAHRRRSGHHPLRLRRAPDRYHQTLRPGL